MRRIQKFCPLCGAENPINARHCRDCGSAFEMTSVQELPREEKVGQVNYGSDASDSSDSSDGSDSSDSSNASVSRPATYVFSFSLVFFIAIIYYVLFI